MSDKDILGLLIGVGLLVAFTAYMAYIYFHPEGFSWLEIRSTSPKTPTDGTKHDAA